MTEVKPADPREFRDMRLRGQNPVQRAVGKIAAASKKNNVAPGALEAARQELLAARLDREIDRALYPEPPYSPLNDELRSVLAERLAPRDEVL